MATLHPQNSTSPDSPNWLRSVTLRHRFGASLGPGTNWLRSVTLPTAARHATPATPTNWLRSVTLSRRFWRPPRLRPGNGFVPSHSRPVLATPPLPPLPRIGFVLPELPSRHFFQPVLSNPPFGRSPPASSPVETTASVCYAQGVEFITLVLPGRCGQAYPRG